MVGVSLFCLHWFVCVRVLVFLFAGEVSGLDATDCGLVVDVLVGIK